MILDIKNKRVLIQFGVYVLTEDYKIDFELIADFLIFWYCSSNRSSTLCRKATFSRYPSLFFCFSSSLIPSSSTNLFQSNLLFSRVFNRIVSETPYLIANLFKRDSRRLGAFDVHILGSDGLIAALFCVANWSDFDLILIFTRSLNGVLINKKITRKIQ